MLVKAVLEQTKTTALTAALKLKVMKNVFGLDSRDEKLYQKMESELQEAIIPHLQRINDAQQTPPIVVKHFLANLPDLITFNQSIVDQEPWERLSFVSISADSNTAKASLLSVLLQLFFELCDQSLLT